MELAGWNGAVSLNRLHLPLTPTAFGSSATFALAGSCECHTSHIHIHPVLPISDQTVLTRRTFPSFDAINADYPYSSTDM